MWTRHILILAILLFATNTHAQQTNFAWLSIAPEIGYTYFFETELDKDLNANIPSRNGVVLKGHVDIGGDGLALELAPLYAFEAGGGLFGDFHVFGGEATLVYRFSAGNVYPGIGIGFHGAYIFETDYIEAGTQLYARAPLGLTWYFAEYLGLVVEAGVMFGGTGIRAKSDDQDAVRNALAGNMEFGAGFAFDIMVGIRFP